MSKKHTITINIEISETERIEIADVRSYLKEIFREILIENQELTINNNKNKISDPTKLFSITDVCQIFGVSRVTIHLWRKSGKLTIAELGVRFISLNQIFRRHYLRLIYQTGDHFLKKGIRELNEESLLSSNY